MAGKQQKIKRERKTIKAMVEIYCKGIHRSKSNLCKGCQAILDYANLRLLKCPYQHDKPTCKNCTTHCYKEPEKSQILKIMNYSESRILFFHPLLAIRHLLDGFTKK